MPNILAVIFDMDGVLIDARQWHFKALKIALADHGFELDDDYHEAMLDGLPTKDKLEILKKEFGLKQSLFGSIDRHKQKITIELAKQLCRPEQDKKDLLTFLQNCGLRLGLCSNAKQSSIDLFMKLADLSSYFDFMLSCENVPHPKPSPDIYIRGMEILGSKPENTLIVEDSDFGYDAAVKSGAHVLRVSGPDDVNIDFLTQRYTNLKTSIKL